MPFKIQEVSLHEHVLGNERSIEWSNELVVHLRTTSCNGRMDTRGYGQRGRSDTRGSWCGVYCRNSSEEFFLPGKCGTVPAVCGLNNHLGGLSTDGLLARLLSVETEASTSRFQISSDFDVPYYL